MHSIGKRDWNRIKKQLPKNYRIETRKILLEKGFDYKLHEISDAVRGRLKNLEKLQIILNAIVMVVEIEKEKKEEIYKIISC